MVYSSDRLSGALWHRPARLSHGAFKPHMQHLVGFGDKDLRTGRLKNAGILVVSAVAAIQHTNHTVRKRCI